MLDASETRADESQTECLEQSLLAGEHSQLLPISRGLVKTSPWGLIYDNFQPVCHFYRREPRTNIWPAITGWKFITHESFLRSLLDCRRRRLQRPVPRQTRRRGNQLVHNFRTIFTRKPRVVAWFTVSSWADDNTGQKENRCSRMRSMANEGVASTPNVLLLSR